MNQTLTKNNPENSPRMFSKDKSDSTDQLSSSSTHETIDCSTQVNLDDQFFERDPPKGDKKSKRKQYKQRKKTRKQAEQKCAKTRLGEIIEGIYDGKLGFQTAKNEIQQCLKHLIKGDKFHSFLNEAIRLHVSNIQKNIWEYMQSIIDENPFEKSEEDQEFYLLVVEKIYSEYMNLRISSMEIEKIINLFMQITSNEMIYDTERHELDRNTFNFLIESEENIKNLMRICYRKISSKYVEQRKKLKQMVSMINFYHHDLQISDEEDEYEEKSTSIGEQDEEIEEIPSFKAKKKKKKLKEQHFSSQYKDVIHKLQNMVIVEKERRNCPVNNSWLSSLKNKVSEQL